MDFLLIFDWIDTETGESYDTHIEYYKTKKDLFFAKRTLENLFGWRIKNGKLILSAAVSYSWDEINQLF